MNTEQQTQARQRIEARRMAMAARISDIGRAENQPISAEVREFLDDEIAQLQRRINELEEQAESFKARIANQEPVSVHDAAFDEGWQDGVAGKPQNLSRVCLGNREWDAYTQGWEAGQKRKPVGVHPAPNVRRAGGK